MTDTQSEAAPFISYLGQLRDRQDRAALAALRRGLGKDPGEAPEMFRYVVPWLPAEGWADRRYFTTAALFAMHPEEGGSGNMGDHFAKVRAATSSDEAVERRFTALLSAHSDDLPYHLRQAVSLCHARGVPVNWDQLFKDMAGWEWASHSVQRQWARSFWGRSQEKANEE